MVNPMQKTRGYKPKRENAKCKGLDYKDKMPNKGLSKYEKAMNGIAVWASFYRANPHKFVEDYLGIELKLFQIILIYMMNHMNYFMYIASRGQGKSYLTAIYCVVRAILWPETKIVIASKVFSQGRAVTSKIKDEILPKSHNLQREISEFKDGANEVIVRFHNGSWIRVVTSSPNSRSGRGNLLIVDEFILVDLDVINKVLRKFLGPSRQPKYLKKDEYKHLLERNKEVYLSSAGYKMHWGWEKCKSYFKSMIEGKRYFICSLPYQLAIKENLKMREEVLDEMSESDFDPIAWSMEMGALFYGESERAYFKIKELQECRRELKAIYPSTSIEKASKKKDTNKIEKLENEIRLIGVDIALMASSKFDNDNTCIVVMRLIPDGDEYKRQVLYIESCSGENTEELSIKIKRLFYTLECDYCVLDSAGNALGVFDLMGTVLFDKELDIEYPTWTCLNDEDGTKGMKERTRDPNALPVIYAVKASSEFNHKIATNLKTCFEKKKIRLLVSENEAKDYLIDKKGFMKKEPEEQNKLLMPYIQTSLLINEIVNLEAEVKNGYIKLTEVGRARKDRYSSLAYTNYFASILEKDLVVYDDDDDLENYICY